MKSASVMAVLLLAANAAFPATPFTLLKSVPAPGEGGWDYLIVDEAGRRVYVSHGNQVEVLDADSYEVKGTIPETKGVHGIALAPELGRGFTSNGGSDSVTIFDLKTLKSLGDVKVGRNPDAIIYDAVTKQVFCLNGGGKSATVIDAKQGSVAGSIELSGRPEFAAADGAGHVFVNIMDKSSLIKIDAKSRKVLEQWPLAPGETPTSLAMDVKGKRLFVGCRNKLFVVVDAANGKVVAQCPIGQGADAASFDPATSNVFVSCADGTIAVIHSAGNDMYEVIDTIKTRPRSKTMALDLKTHRLFVPAAKFEPGETPKSRPVMTPKSFAILVYGQEK